MGKDKKLTEMNSYSEIADFWDTHSLADYWDKTEPAEFDISGESRRKYLVPVDGELLTRVHTVARTRGISTESLVNLLVEQRLNEVST